MARRRITDIARERGLDPNEVARALHEAGVALRGDTVDEAAAARALAGSRPTPSQKKTAGAKPKATVETAPGAAHPNALAPEPKREERAATAAPRTGREGARPGADGTRPPRSARTFDPTSTAPIETGQPRPGAPGGTPPRQPRTAAPSGKRRRVVIDSQAARGPRDTGRRGGGRERAPERVERPITRPTGPVTVESGVSVKELSGALGVPLAEIIKILMLNGQMVTITQSLADEAVEFLGLEFEREITIKHVEDDLEEVVFEDEATDLVTRAPVVTIMGHVDHGKTSLLDAIRQTDVAAGEAGGITQHIGAYQVKLAGDRAVTFLDTPGHEAFTQMRARGAKVTDVVVLVVAADDGVMPQTVEAIDHARAAEVPIIVAVNKIDKPGANPERVRQELATRGLQPEEWGGQTIFVDVSAREKTGLDTLLEMLLLQADVLELKANRATEASGSIVESRLDVGRGPVTTMLVQRGTLHAGDALVAGAAWGRVRAMFDYHGNAIQEAGPSVPVEILGFDRPPATGEQSRVVESDRVARQLAGKREQRERVEELLRTAQNKTTWAGIFSAEGQVKELALIIKGDVQGSVEAAVSELEKFKNDEVKVKVVRSAVGGITQSDVDLASASDAIIVGFNVRPNQDARAAAEKAGIEIKTYRVIYELTKDIERALVGLLEPETVEEITGQAEVRELFRVSRLGAIAGSMITQGTIHRTDRIRVVREGVVVWDGAIRSLRRVKDDVREVAQGFECGVLLDGFNDVKEGDVLEAYVSREVERTEL